MQDKKEFSTMVSGVCFALMFFLVFAMLWFAMGKSYGFTEGKAEALRPIIRQGELPYNVPVMVYTINPDGTIAGESAIRTDYAGVLPFSTTGKAVDLYGIGEYDYWMELSAVMWREP